MFVFNILVFLSDLIVTTVTVNDNTMIGVKQCSMNTAINNLSSQNTFLKELKAFDNLSASNYKKCAILWTQFNFQIDPARAASSANEFQNVK